MEGLCNSKHPSVSLVCRLIMSLAEGFYSQFLICLPSFANLPNIQTYQPPEEVYSLIISVVLFVSLDFTL